MFGNELAQKGDVFRCDDPATVLPTRPAYVVSLPETNLERKQILCFISSSRSPAAIPAELPPPDWPAASSNCA